MIEIWSEFGRFKATNQRLADQVRTILRNGWFSDLEIREIHQQIYRQTYQQTPIKVTEKLITEKLLQKLLTKTKRKMVMAETPQTKQRKR